MRYTKILSFFLIGFVIVGALSVAKPTLAQEIAQDVKIDAERMKNDAGALSAVTGLFGKDAPIVKKFQFGIKLGEFIVRVSQGDILGAATDLAKYELGQAIDTVKGKLFGPFVAAADLGKWLGEKGRDIHFVSVFNDGYKIYESEGGMGEFYISEIAGWWDKGGVKFEKEKGSFPVWEKAFKILYEAKKQAAGIKQEDIKKVELVKKEIKKDVFVAFFKTKYIGMPTTLAEELSDLILDNASDAKIENFINEHKDALDKLSTAKPAGAVSSGNICQGTKDEEKSCLDKLQKLIEQREKVLSNEITYWDYLKTADSIRPAGAGISAYSGMPKEGSIGADNLAKFKESQRMIIASAYEFQFGQEIQVINDSLAANKDKFQSLKNDYKNLPEQGDHWNLPSYKVSASKGLVRVFNNVYNKVFNSGSFNYEDFKNETAQKNYQEYFDNETKANAADSARAKYLKSYLVRANGLVRDFTVLQNRINSLISSAESAKGVFSYGEKQTTLDDLKKTASEIEGFKKDVQSGEKHFWIWRQGEWSVDSVSETIKEMKNDKKTRESSINQLKNDYISALKIYEEEEKQRELEKQKQAEEENNTAAEKEAKDLQKQKTEEEAWNQEKERLEAEKQAAAEKARSEQSTDAFNVPFGESQETPDETAPVTDTVKPVTTQPKPVSPSVQPSVQTSSTLPSGYSNIPNENEEMSGFSFINGYKADMMTSDFFWNYDGIYTVNGALDLGVKSMNSVASVPASGYQFDPYQPEVGHVYAIKTRGGKYGIIEIAYIENTLDAGNKLSFFWRYQPNGSTSFQ